MSEEISKKNTLKKESSKRPRKKDALEELASKSTYYDMYAIDGLITKRQCAALALLENNMCNISNACKTLKMSRKTFYEWKQDNVMFRELYEEIEESEIDVVESKLKENILDGNVVAQMFYLKTKGKSRGYVEKIENESKVELIGFDFVEVVGEENE